MLPERDIEVLEPTEAIDYLVNQAMATGKFDVFAFNRVISSDEYTEPYDPLLLESGLRALKNLQLPGVLNGNTLRKVNRYFNGMVELYQELAGFPFSDQDPFDEALWGFVFDTNASGRFQQKKFRDIVYATDPGLKGLQERDQLASQLEKGLEKLGWIREWSIFSNGSWNQLERIENIYTRMERDYTSLRDELNRPRPANIDMDFPKKGPIRRTDITKPPGGSY